MSNLKKIDAQLKALEKVSESTLKVLNEVTEGGYLDASQVEDKLHFLPQMIRNLYHLKQTLTENEPFEGLTEEDAAKKKAADKEAAMKKLQEDAAATLEKIHADRNPKTEEAEPIEEES